MKSEHFAVFWDTLLHMEDRKKKLLIACACASCLKGIICIHLMIYFLECSFAFIQKLLGDWEVVKRVTVIIKL